MSRVQTRRMHSIYLPAAPEHSESAQCSVLTLRGNTLPFYAIPLGFLSLPFILAQQQRSDVWILSNSNHCLFRIFSLCRFGLIFQTFKNIFPAFKCWIKIWDGFWFWLLSKLQRPISYRTVWPSCSCLCLSLTSWAEYILLEASKANGPPSARLFLFFSSLFLFSWFCKALTTSSELTRVTKISRMTVFCVRGMPWNQMALKTYIFMCWGR